MDLSPLQGVPLPPIPQEPVAMLVQHLKPMDEGATEAQVKQLGDFALLGKALVKVTLNLSEANEKIAQLTKQNEQLAEQVEALAGKIHGHVLYPIGDKPIPDHMYG